MRYKHAFFDFDGTIADSSAGITRCVKYALSQYGITENDMSVLRRFIGPPLQDMFMEIYGFSREQADEAVLHYRVEYVNKGLYETTIFDGIPECLKTLSDAGVKCSIASNKPTEMIDRMLLHFGLTEYITYVSGLQEGVHTKTAAISLLQEKLGIQDDPSCAVMIGDRSYDAEGAMNRGVDFIAAVYGFGTPEEFAPYPRIGEVSRPLDIINIVLGV